MATYKVLYWQDIPSQINAEDDADEICLPLGSAFTERIDQLAVERGLAGADHYLAQWHWSDAHERDGTAQEVAEAVKAEFEANANSW